MSLNNPFIEAAGNLGAGIGQAISGFQEGRITRRELALKEAAADQARTDALLKAAQERYKGVRELGRDMTAAEDWQGAAGIANQLPALAKKAYGVDLPGGDIVGAPVFGTRMADKPLPPGQLGPPQQVPTPFDTGRRNFDNPKTQAAIAGRVGPQMKLTAEQQELLKRAALDMQASIASKRVTSAEKIAAGHDATRVTTTGMNNTTRTNIANTKPAPGASQDARVWSQHIADFGRDFPGVTITSTTRSPAHNKKVGGVPGSYHTKGLAFDAVVPPMAEAKARRWAAERGMEVIVEDPGTPNYHWHFEPRTGVPAKPPTKPKTPTPKAAPLVRVQHPDGTVTMEPRTEGLQVKPAAAPKPPKPFDADKARKNVMASMGLRPSQRIRPDQQGRYDTLMQQERDAYNRTQNGGKTALQMLLEMPD